jgi:hypothetical protein
MALTTLASNRPNTGHITSVPAEHTERPLLVLRSNRRIADDVGEHYDSEPALAEALVRTCHDWSVTIRTAL